MAVRAYAALMSLMHTFEVILHPSLQWLCTNRIQIESLLQKVRSLQKFLEDYSHRDHEEMASLGSRIAEMARAADSVIDYHVLVQFLARSNGREAGSSSFSEYIQNLVKEMEDLIEMEVMRIKESTRALEEARPLRVFSPAVSSRSAPKDQISMVGADQKLLNIMDTLTRQQSNRQIIAIVGMGGIGKTTLAQNVYKHPHTSSYFHICAWGTVSQNYSARKIILEMLSVIDRSEQVGIPIDDQLDGQLYMSKQESLRDDQLGEQLHKILSGKRYLIVMDDLWSIEAWDEIRAFFPDNCNGSCIMITTRELNVARQLNSFMSFEMELLDDDQSWMLLCGKVFGEEGCPPELEELGKDIAKNCRGLPLAIVVIGGLLAKSKKTLEVWENAVENLNSIISSGNEGNCIEILNLSYENLPIHLKTCFLYIAVTSNYRESMLPDMAWLLVGEGFLKPIRDKSLEEVANEYMTDLIDRNLIFVHEIGSAGELKVTGMHKFLGDLCLKHAQEENFISAKDEHNLDVETSQVPDILRQATLIRSTTRVYASRLIVWNGLEVVGDFSPVQEEITQPPFIRLSFLNRQNLNSMRRRFIDAIPLFWCLQSLIVTSTPGNLITLPSEIWHLPQLRHLLSNMVFLCDPVPPQFRNDMHNPHILENLQTLVGVLGFRCREEVYERAPNLKMLKVVYTPVSPPEQWDAFFCLYNLVHFHKLETLRFHSRGPISLNHLSFPISLKKLTSIGCHLPWKDMAIVGSLPNLEALGLHSCTFEGQIWGLVDEKFLRLKNLGIGETELLNWNADRTHFPILEHMVLRSLNLEEFPEDFGELLTLRKIEVFSCNDSTNAWAEQIREEQESFGNEDLQVLVKPKEEDD